MVLVKICLEDVLERCGVTRYELAKRTGIQYQIIDNYYKNRVKRYDGYVLERICAVLDCEVGDILKIEK